MRESLLPRSILGGKRYGTNHASSWTAFMLWFTESASKTSAHSPVCCMNYRANLPSPGYSIRASSDSNVGDRA